MPTYDLTCNDCGERYEIFVMRMLRNDDLVCPACGSTDIRRGIGGGVVQSPSTGGSQPAPSCGNSVFG